MEFEDGQPREHLEGVYKKTSSEVQYVCNDYIITVTLLSWPWCSECCSPCTQIHTGERIKPPTVEFVSCSSLPRSSCSYCPLLSK